MGCLEKWSKKRKRIRKVQTWKREITESKVTYTDGKNVLTVWGTVPLEEQVLKVIATRDNEQIDAYWNRKQVWLEQQIEKGEMFAAWAEECYDQLSLAWERVMSLTKEPVELFGTETKSVELFGTDLELFGT